MDEKLKWRLVELSTTMVEATDFTPVVEQFKQAFRAAGWTEPLKCEHRDFGSYIREDGKVVCGACGLAFDAPTSVPDWVPREKLDFAK